MRGLARSRGIAVGTGGRLLHFTRRLLLAPAMGMQNIDLVHSHIEIRGHQLLPVVKALRVPLVVTFHGLELPGNNQLPQAKRKEYLDAAQLVLVNTDFARRQYMALGCPEDKIRILPQGIDLRRFPFQPHPPPVRGPVRVLTVARFHPDKGQVYAIDAVAALIGEGFDLVYDLVGTGPDRDRLLGRIRDLGLSHKVTLHERLPFEQLIELYRSSHVFILPSVRSTDGTHEETQGVVIQEAQASGLITIATRTGGIPECIEDNVTGFLVDDRSSAAIADKLRDIIAAKGRWQQWQKQARECVEQNYDIDLIIVRLMALYEEAISLHARGNAAIPKDGNECPRA